jgi:hypothetical protein
MAPQFAGDRLAILPPVSVVEVVDRFLSHTQCDLGFWRWLTRRKNVAHSTGTFPPFEGHTLHALCRVWLSGDSVAIVRYRNETPTRLAIIERTSASTAIGKMYFGPVHDAWSSTDQALYDTGIRRVEAYYVNRRHAEGMEELAGHVVSGNSVAVDLDLFRQEAHEVCV